MTEEIPINEDLLEYPQVRIVGEADESKNGIYDTEEALEIARERSLDLVQITVSNGMPICRIVEFSKYKYEIKKKEKERKAKQQVTQVKEIRFGPNTDDHDFEFKKKHAEAFLKDGDKVRAFVLFKGRSIIYQDYGLNILNRFAEELSHISKVEVEPKLEGKRLFMVLAPKKS